jgi:hypothetical protein
VSLIKAGTDPRAAKAATIARDTADRGTAKVERQRQQVTGLEAWGDYCTARASHWSERHARNHAVMVQDGGEARTRSKVKTTQAGILPPPAGPSAGADRRRHHRRMDGR